MRWWLSSVLAMALGCVGSGVDVAPSHPASPDAPAAPLAEVGGMLVTDAPPAAPPVEDPHAHHHHHHGASE
jgi:hypothetical protein